MTSRLHVIGTIFLRVTYTAFSSDETESYYLRKVSPDDRDSAGTADTGYEHIPGPILRLCLSTRTNTPTCFLAKGLVAIFGLAPTNEG